MDARVRDVLHSEGRAFMVKKRQQFPEESKLEAVQLALEWDR